MGGSFPAYWNVTIVMVHVYYYNAEIFTDDTSKFPYRHNRAKRLKQRFASQTEQRILLNQMLADK